MIKINSPTTEDSYLLEEYNVNISGTADLSIKTITYSVNTVAGAVYGTATGISNWKIDNLTLEPGSNVI